MRLNKSVKQIPCYSKMLVTHLIYISAAFALCVSPLSGHANNTIHTYAITDQQDRSEAEQSRIILLQLYTERAARLIADYYLHQFTNNELFTIQDKANTSLTQQKSQFSGGPHTIKDLIDPHQVITIRTEHAIAEDAADDIADDPIKPTIKIKGFEEFTAWRESLNQGVNQLYDQRINILGACIHGCCEYPSLYGIDHNKLYLQQACFITANDKPILKSILIMNSN